MLNWITFAIHLQCSLPICAYVQFDTYLLELTMETLLPQCHFQQFQYARLEEGTPGHYSISGWLYLVWTCQQ